jgi:hypothetical protein
MSALEEFAADGVEQPAGPENRKRSSITQAPVAQAAANPPPVNVLIRPSMITISKQQDHYSIKGYALDPSASGDSVGIDHVDLYMDEVRGKGGSVFLGTAELRQDQPEAAANFGPRSEMAGYQVDFKPANFAVGNHHIYAIRGVRHQRSGNGRGYGLRHRPIAPPPDFASSPQRVRRSICSSATDRVDARHAPARPPACS